MTTYKEKQYTLQQVKQMRDWAKDCQWADNIENDPDFFDALTPEEICKGVDENHEGGIDNFSFDIDFTFTRRYDPAAASTAWDAVEIEPMWTDGVNDEPCDEGEELFWSVFLHQVNGGVLWVADAEDKEEAIKIKTLLENAAQAYRPIDRKKPAVYAMIEGGNLQGASATEPINLVVFDMDNYKAAKGEDLALFIASYGTPEDWDKMIKARTDENELTPIY